MTQPADDLLWVILDNVPGCDEPDWKRRVAIDAEGTVFVPAALTGDESACAFRAGSQKILPVILRDEHVYVPVRWMAREYPHGDSALCEFLERTVHARVRKNQGADPRGNQP